MGAQQRLNAPKKTARPEIPVLALLGRRFDSVDAPDIAGSHFHC